MWGHSTTFTESQYLMCLKLFYFSFLLDWQFGRIWHQGQKCFPLELLKALCYYFLAFSITSEKSDAILIFCWLPGLPFWKHLIMPLPWPFPMAQHVKSLPAIQKTQETRVRFLGGEGLLEEEMATDSSIFAWKIPWIEEPGGLQSKGSQRVGRDWATKYCAGYSEIVQCEFRWVLFSPLCLTLGGLFLTVNLGLSSALVCSSIFT